MMSESNREKIYRLKSQAVLETRCVVALYFYLISDGTGAYKIGRSEDPNKRLSALQVGSSRKLTLIHHSKIDQPEVEEALHWLFDEAKERGEWYRLTDSQIDFLKSL
jgi:hypothetical protein